jgi:GNAT superfamily N-acetyltransferase
LLTNNLRIERLSELNRSDFFKVLAMGEFGDCCFCVFWWQTSLVGWGDRTCEQNRQFRDGLFSQHVYDGYLLYIDDVPQGWCQSGLRDQWPTLLKNYALTPDENVWAITCFVLNPEWTGKGVAHLFLHEVLTALKQQGVARVQAFPHLGRDLKNDEVWPGPVSIYEKAGFVTVKADERRPILELSL